MRRFSWIVACWTHMHGVIGSNTCEIIFMQQPRFYFALYKELLHQSFVFSENL
jgi:hypothetical protein